MEIWQVMFTVGRGITDKLQEEQMLPCPESKQPIYSFLQSIVLSFHLLASLEVFKSAFVDSLTTMLDLITQCAFQTIEGLRPASVFTVDIVMCHLLAESYGHTHHTYIKIVKQRVILLIRVTWTQKTKSLSSVKSASVYQSTSRWITWPNRTYIQSPKFPKTLLVNANIVILEKRSMVAFPLYTYLRGDRLTYRPHVLHTISHAHTLTATLTT